MFKIISVANTRVNDIVNTLTLVDLQVENEQVYLGAMPLPNSAILDATMILSCGS